MKEEQNRMKSMQLAPVDGGRARAPVHVGILRDRQTRRSPGESEILLLLPITQETSPHLTTAHVYSIQVRRWSGKMYRVITMGLYRRSQ